MVRVFGSCLILLGCGIIGCLITRSMGDEIITLRNFIAVMEYMECELRCRMTPLPKLCRGAAMASCGVISNVFLALSAELESQNSVDAFACMTLAMYKYKNIPEKAMQLLERLGKSLGLFDLNGQLHMLAALRQEANRMLKICEEGHRVRSRSCKTIALCIGAAIVVLLL